MRTYPPKQCRAWIYRSGYDNHSSNMVFAVTHLCGSEDNDFGSIPATWITTYSWPNYDVRADDTGGIFFDLEECPHEHRGGA